MSQYWTFEPTFMAKRKLGAIASGLEYHAAFGPIAHPLPWSDEEHDLYETVDLPSSPVVELNFRHRRRTERGKRRLGRQLEGGLRLGKSGTSAAAPAGAPDDALSNLDPRRYSRNCSAGGGSAAGGV